uniref:Uncharacterized protein n=1 Tax=Guillardia theta TaxID=55529 RepID=A0A7S4KSM8_GUITH|mmetsp:Transcript_30328/g.97616  ORF Transcript_30328/g.97616 Transcript_30328/m.97616 type:complete len:384 (+) Transcript_30328:94-1245(+)
MSKTAYAQIHTARFGKAEEDVAPLTFVKPLTDLCLQSAALNFKSRPTFAGIPEKFKENLCKLIPTDLPLQVSAPLIESDVYWKRCASDLFQNCLPQEHGHSWKQLFFERTAEEAIENFDGSQEAMDALIELLLTSRDFIYKLQIRQFSSHADVSFLFDALPNLYSLNITYGSKNVGMKYERSIFGMKLTDAELLAQQLAKTETLTTLILNENMLDDEKVRRLVVGLRDNITITHLDLSHNKISDRGTRALCKCLGKDSVISTLILCDNHIHSEGGKFLGRSLQTNTCLINLNLRLNRFLPCFSFLSPFASCFLSLLPCQTLSPCELLLLSPSLFPFFTLFIPFPISSSYCLSLSCAFPAALHRCVVDSSSDLERKEDVTSSKG